MKKYSPGNIYSFVKYLLWKTYSSIKNFPIEKKTELEFNSLYKKNILVKGIEKDSSKKLIISLTSYPKRFPKLHLVLYSLLKQTVKPNKLILILSKKEIEKEEDIPNKILFLKKYGLEIKFVKENYKPYNKLIYTIKDFPEYNIITVDDDIIYPKWFLEKLFLKHKEYPQDIICYRAHLIKKTSAKIGSYSKWMNYDLKKFYQGENLFPLGVCGVLYPSGSLNKEIFNSDVFLKICPYNDDLWFKAMSLLNKTNCRRVFKNKNPHPFLTLRRTQEKSLWDINQSKNDEQIKKVFKKYNLYKFLSDIK